MKRRLFYLQCVALVSAAFLSLSGCDRTEKDEKPEASGQWVDLGLPSGLLWANCNIGASSPTDYGNYYAWGETQSKSVYDFSTYQYYRGDNGISGYTKYCNISDYGYNGFTDNLTTLQSSDDAAAANWGGGARMPTAAEWQELINNTTHQWVTIYGVNGQCFTGSNGNSIFLPAAGGRVGASLNDDGLIGYYWSSSLGTDYPFDARGCYFDSGVVGNWDYGGRYFGYSVRAVRQN